MNAIEIVSQARRALVMDYPFFGMLALRLRPVETLSVKTFSTDGKSLYFNPLFATSLGKMEIVAVLAHEVLHCANNHTTRRNGRDHKLWSKACDYAINGILKRTGFKLPERVLLDPEFDGMPAEQIYDLLLKQSQQAESQAQGSSGGRDNQGSSGESDNQETDPQENGSQDHGDNDPGLNDDNHDQGDNPSQGEDDCDHDQSQENGGHGGDNPDQGDKEQDQDDEGDWNFGEVLDAPESEKTLIEAEWKEAVVTAANLASKHGDLPAEIRRIVDEIKDPPQDWRAILARFVQEASLNDYSWKIPNGRYAHMGTYLPSLKSEDIGTVVIAIDTSGSIDGDLLSKFLSEVQAAVDATQPKCTYAIACDAEVQEVAVFQSGDEIKLPLKGGGGTNFRPVFEYIEQEGINPACLIYFTDMAGCFPDDAPDYPVLWVSFGSYWIKAPFGEVVEIY